MTTLPVFLTAMFLLNITPGPDMLYVLARATGQGRAAGLASAFGIGAGCFFHIFAVAFGLAELLRTVPLAYNAVRYAGAAYLIYLGARTLLARSTGAGPVTVRPASLARVFAQGVITNVLNPKVALFFLAFLPQFIDARSSAFGQTVRLGLIFDLSGTLVNVAVALAASSVGNAVRDRISSGGNGVRLFRWLTGGVFIGLGVRLLFGSRGTGTSCMCAYRDA
jgi:threonine/homoserine/homoserine lactone efflux protein